MSARKHGTIVGFLGLVVVVAIASYSWACVQQGSFTGVLWLCRSGVTSCPVSQETLSPTHSQNFYSMASGLTPNSTYDVRYTPGNHTPDTDSACWSGGTIFTGGAGILTDASGSWSAKGPLTMPSSTGIYTICAVAPVSPSNFTDPKMKLITVA